MPQTVPHFAQLSTKNPNKQKTDKVLTRKGHMMDLIKTNPWRTLQNY